MKTKIFVTISISTAVSISAHAEATIFETVDRIKNRQELLMKRQVGEHRLDTCFLGKVDEVSFAEVIDKAINYSLRARVLNDNGYGIPYSLGDNKRPVSLVHYPMCEFNEAEMKHLLVDPYNVVDEATRKVAQKIIDTHNRRHSALKKSLEAKERAEALIEQNQKAIAKASADLKRALVRRERKDQLRAEIERLSRENEGHRQAIVTAESEIAEGAKAMKPVFQALFGCLAYGESLNDADAEKHLPMYQKFVDENLISGPKPSGVKYYKDRFGSYKKAFDEFDQKKLSEEEFAIEIFKAAQTDLAKEKYGKVSMEKAREMVKTITASEYAALLSPSEWEAIGMYQFAPNNPKKKHYSNISPCIGEWNDVFRDRPECQIKNDRRAHVEMLSTPAQSFNAFCGVMKINQQFDSMVNSPDPSLAALGNRSGLGLKAPADRCVSLFAKGGTRAYAHFGPLANSVPKVRDLPYGNFRLVVQCMHDVLF